MTAQAGVGVINWAEAIEAKAAGNTAAPARMAFITNRNLFPGFTETNDLLITPPSAPSRQVSPDQLRAGAKTPSKGAGHRCCVVMKLHCVLHGCLLIPAGVGRRTLGRNWRLRRNRRHVIGCDKMIGGQALRAQEASAK